MIINILFNYLLSIPSKQNNFEKIFSNKDKIYTII